MQNEVQKVIGQTLKDGTMHILDWDSKNLIPMKEDVSPVEGAAVSASSIIHHNKQELADEQVSNQFIGSSGYRIKKETVVSNNGNYIRKSKVSSSSSSSYYSRSALDDTYSKQLPQNNSYYGRQESNLALPENYTPFQGREESNSALPDKCIPYRQTERKKKKRGNQWVRDNGKNSEFDKSSEKKRRQDKNYCGFQKNNLVLDNRAKRFGGSINTKTSPRSTNEFDKYMGKGLIGGLSKLDENDYERMTVKGTCQILEKEYLRLTAPPKAERVRPQPVLERHLQNLIKEHATTTSRDYVWFCSHLKAIRQDLTVQRIFNNFAVLVYETHARIALQEMDLNEYNQCQTQLKELYVTLSDCQKALVNQNEFIAYRLIYYVFLLGNKKYEGGSSDLFDIMLSLNPEQRKHHMIDYALKVRSAVADSNYHIFFRLQNNAPTPSMAFLIDYLVPGVRFWALQRVCKAYKPSISIEFVLFELGFKKEQIGHGLKWLESCGCVLSKDRQFLQTKDCVVHESDLKAQNSLI